MYNIDYFIQLFYYFSFLVNYLFDSSPELKIQGIPLTKSVEFFFYFFACFHYIFLNGTNVDVFCITVDAAPQLLYVSCMYIHPI